MKTIYLSILVGLSLIFFSTSEINAQKNTQTIEKNPGFIDKDGDGVCDNYDGKRIGRGMGEGGGRRAMYGDSLQYRNRRFAEADSNLYRGRRFKDGEKTQQRQRPINEGDSTFYKGRKFGDRDSSYFNHRRPNNPNYKGNPKHNYRRENIDFQGRPQDKRRMRDGSGSNCPNPEINKEN